MKREFMVKKMILIIILIVSLNAQMVYSYENSLNSSISNSKNTASAQLIVIASDHLIQINDSQEETQTTELSGRLPRETELNQEITRNQLTGMAIRTNASQTNTLLIALIILLSLILVLIIYTGFIKKRE